MPLVFAHIEHRHDVRMIQLRGRLGFRVKSLHVLRRRKSTGQDHLQSDLAFGLQLMRAIHHPHAAAGNFAQQFVVPKATQPHATQRLRLAAILIMEKAEWCLQWGSLDWAAFLPAREPSGKIVEHFWRQRS